MISSLLLLTSSEIIPPLIAIVFSGSIAREFKGKEQDVVIEYYEILPSWADKS